MIHTQKSKQYLSLEDLTYAIINIIDTDMKKITAEEMARHILDFFGYQDRIIDNLLKPEDRNSFYILEDYKILITESEETKLPDGRIWRIHYWKINSELIDLVLGKSKEKTLEEQVFLETEDVYENLDWIRSNKEPEQKPEYSETSVRHREQIEQKEREKQERKKEYKYKRSAVDSIL